MEVVGALLRHRVDDAAGGRAELGVELARQQLEFLDRFDRRARLRAAVAVVEVVVVAGAIQHVVRVLRRLAVDADRVGAERIDRQRRGDAGQQAQIRREVAVERRHVLQLLRRHAAAELLGRRVDDRRFGGDRHFLLDAADFELHVDRLRLADLDADALLRWYFLNPESCAVSS